MSIAPKGAMNKKGGSVPRPPDGTKTARQVELDQNEKLWRLNVRRTHTYYGIRKDDPDTPRIIDGQRLADELRVLGRFFEDPILAWAADIIVGLGLTDGSPATVAKRIWAQANHHERMACFWVDRELSLSKKKLSHRLACERVTARLGLPGGSLNSARAALEAEYRRHLANGRAVDLNRFPGRTGRQLYLTPVDTESEFDLQRCGQLVGDNRDRRKAVGAGQVFVRLMPAKTVENRTQIIPETEKPDPS